jgi:hypothetical protein
MNSTNFQPFASNFYVLLKQKLALSGVQTNIEKNDVLDLFNQALIETAFHTQPVVANVSVAKAIQATTLVSSTTAPSQAAPQEKKKLLKKKLPADVAAECDLQSSAKKQKLAETPASPIAASPIASPSAQKDGEKESVNTGELQRCCYVSNEGVACTNTFAKPAHVSHGLVFCSFVHYNRQRQKFYRGKNRQSGKSSSSEASSAESSPVQSPVASPVASPAQKMTDEQQPEPVVDVQPEEKEQVEAEEPAAEEQPEEPVEAEPEEDPFKPALEKPAVRGFDFASETPVKYIPNKLVSFWTNTKPYTHSVSGSSSPLLHPTTGLVLAVNQYIGITNVVGFHSAETNDFQTTDKLTPEMKKWISACDLLIKPSPLAVASKPWLKIGKK